MKTPVAPEHPPELLPGPTAKYWVRRQTNWLVAGMLVLPIIGLGSLLPQPARAAVIVVAIVIGVACSIRAGHAAINEMRAEARERAAGYSTLKVARYKHLWQLDPERGTVVRRPGEAR